MDLCLPEPLGHMSGLRRARPLVGPQGYLGARLIRPPRSTLSQDPIYRRDNEKPLRVRDSADATADG